MVYFMFSDALGSHSVKDFVNGMATVVKEELKTYLQNVKKIISNNELIF